MSKCRNKCIPAPRRDETLGDVLAGTWHVYWGWGEGMGNGCWAGDGQLQGLDLSMHTPCLMAERQVGGWGRAPEDKHSRSEEA
jgi:hypothetical protein